MREFSTIAPKPIIVYLGLATILAIFGIFLSDQVIKNQVSSRITHESSFLSADPDLPPITQDEVITADDNVNDIPIDIWDTEVIKMPSTSFAFENPSLAYKILTKLDVFEPVDESYFAPRTPQYDRAWMGLKNDDFYCHEHRAYIVEHPEAIFEQINFVASPDPSSLMRNKVLSAIGNDIQPHIGLHLPSDERKEFKYDMSLEANIFVGQGVAFYKHIGQHFGCLSQAVAHIPGYASLIRKDYVAESASKYAKLFKDKPQCFSHDTFFPKTWLLYEKEECQEFFQKFNSPEYQRLKEERNIVYIRKVGAGSHRGEGVFPVTQEEEDHLRSSYKNGELCGEETQNYIVQHYVHNPLLIQGRKFDFRMYMLVASTNPIIAFYHDGFLRVSLATYETDTNDKKVLLTNLALNKEIYDEVRAGNLFRGMDEESLKMAQQWSFDRLQNYLLATGVISDPKWLDNYLRPEFKKAMVHLIRMSSGTFLRRSSLYELYGVDFILDENLNIWFIEANTGPVFDGYSQPMEKFIVKMLQDHFEVVIGLMRSRMKRVFNYVNRLIDNGMAEEDKEGYVNITDLGKRINELKAISKNYFELGFQPTRDNGFSKIMDENFYGMQRYQNLLSEECI